MSEIRGQYFYYRKNGGPVLHTRVWDRERFMDSLVAEGRNPKTKEQFEISVASEQDYRKEHQR